MPKWEQAERHAVYAAAEQFVAVALQSDGSLFTPGQMIWSPAVIEDFYQRFVGHPDESSDTFETKLARQLTDAPPETIQLAAESLFVHFLISDTMKGATKRGIIAGVLAWSAHDVSIPSDLDQALMLGLVGPGAYFNTGRPFHLGFLLEFMRAWKALDAAERAQRLSNP